MRLNYLVHNSDPPLSYLGHTEYLHDRADSLLQSEVRSLIIHSTMWTPVWREKRSFQIFFFGLVVKCFIVFVCCSSNQQQNNEVEKGSYFITRKSSFKRLGLQIQYRTCLPSLGHEDENAMARFSQQKKPQLNVLKKDFHFPNGL